MTGSRSHSLPLWIAFMSPLKGEGEDHICWGSLSNNFSVKRFYHSLTPHTSILFPWKIIWKALTIDNLRKRGFILKNWCCMCQWNGERVDHLFLHCPVAMDMWSMVFGLFGMQWVMPSSVLDLFSCRMGSLGRNDYVLVWKMIPHFLIWCLWRERNARLFEDAQRHIHELKLLFFHTLFDWVMGSGISSIHYLLELIDLCKF
jgi:hypothetical protein